MTPDLASRPSAPRCTNHFCMFVADLCPFAFLPIFTSNTKCYFKLIRGSGSRLPHLIGSLVVCPSQKRLWLMISKPTETICRFLLKEWPFSGIEEFKVQHLLYIFYYARRGWSSCGKRTDVLSFPYIQICYYECLLIKYNLVLWHLEVITLHDADLQMVIRFSLTMISRLGKKKKKRKGHFELMSFK